MLRSENKNCSKLLLAGFLKGTQSSKMQVHSWCSSLAQTLNFGSKRWTCLGGSRSGLSPKLFQLCRTPPWEKHPGLLCKTKAKMLCISEKKKLKEKFERVWVKLCRFMPHPMHPPCSTVLIISSKFGQTGTSTKFIISLTFYAKPKKFLWCRKHSETWGE